MASSFPGAIDNFTDPLANSSLASPSHAGQHSDLNDAVEKIETYMGLVKVIPTSVTNGTLAANGTVTVGNAVSSVTVSGAFSSLYDVYKIVMSGGTQSVSVPGIGFQFANITTGQYYGGWVGAAYNTGAVSGLGLNAATTWTYAGIGTGAGNIMEFTVWGANTATRKYCSTGVYFQGAGVYGHFMGECTGTTAETGFKIIPSSGTLTGGTIRVYGYRN